jgi:hypothetical protein
MANGLNFSPQAGLSLGNFEITNPAASGSTANTGARFGAPTQRPFERFTSDLFGFTGGLLDTAGDALDLFGGPPEQNPRGGRGRRGQQQEGIDLTTALLVGGGLLVLVMVMRGKK